MPPSLSSFQARIMYAACGLLITLAGLWAGWTTKTLIELKDIAATRPTHADVREMIFDHSPYRKDEGLLKRNLSDIDAKLNHIDTKLDEVHDAVLILTNNKVAGP